MRALTNLSRIEFSTQNPWILTIDTQVDRMSNREGAQEASSHIDQRVSGAQIAPFPALSEPYLHGSRRYITYNLQVWDSNNKTKKKN